MIVAVIVIAAGWPALAGGQSWLLVAIGVLAAVAPLMSEWIRGRRAAAADAARGWQSVQVVDPDQSVALLLHPASAVVPFFGRARELHVLAIWCDERTVAPVRLIVGSGGVGKTRLARQFATLRERQGWRVSLLRPSDEALGAARTLVAGEPGSRKLLLVADYAECRDPRELARLIAAVVQRNRSGEIRVRLLLLARNAGMWWEQLSVSNDEFAAVVESITRPANVLELAADADTRDPSEIMNDATRAFARRLRLPSPKQAPLALAGDPLLLMHARALVAVLGSPVQGGNNVLAELLTHEMRWWRSRARARMPSLLPDTDPEDLPRALLPLSQLVGMASLLGAANDTQVQELVARTPALARPDAAATRRWAAWLADLYPAGPGKRLGTIQPDLLAEHLAADVILQCDQTQLTALLNGISHDQAVEALTVIGRAAAHRPELRDSLPAVLGSDLFTMTRAVTVVAPRFPKGTYADVLASLIPGDLTTQQLCDLAVDIPHDTTELARLAVAITTAIVTGGIDIDRPHWTHQHALRLAEVGQDRQALTAAEDAASLYRKQVKADRAANLANLAMALNTLARRLAVAGQPQKAHSVSEKSLHAYTELVKIDRRKYLPDLGTATVNHAVRLSEIGRRNDALRSSAQAVALRRELCETMPGKYLPELAMAVSNHSNRLYEAGLHTESLTLSADALNVRRALADHSPDAYLPSLATLLANHACRLAQAGRLHEALEHSNEAIQTCRELAAHNPDKFLPLLATSVLNHATHLAETHDSTALAHSGEAVTITRQLAAENPEAHLPLHAAALANHAGRLAQTRHRESLGTSLESVELYRKLVTGNRKRYLPFLAKSLWSAANCRYLIGVDLPAAATLAAEAVSIYRPLARKEPDAFAHELESAHGIQIAIQSALNG